MLQNMHIAYMRGFEDKPKPKYIRGSLVCVHMEIIKK